MVNKELNLLKGFKFESENEDEDRQDLIIKQVNYAKKIKGSVTRRMVFDNDDGTYTIEYQILK